jgi:hypothetical protein
MSFKLPEVTLQVYLPCAARSTSRVTFEPDGVKHIIHRVFGRRPNFRILVSYQSFDSFKALLQIHLPPMNNSNISQNCRGLLPCFPLRMVNKFQAPSNDPVGFLGMKCADQRITHPFPTPPAKSLL